MSLCLFRFVGLTLSATSSVFHLMLDPDSLKGIIWFPEDWIPDSFKGIIRFMGYPGIGGSRNAGNQ